MVYYILERNLGSWY